MKVIRTRTRTFALAALLVLPACRPDPAPARPLVLLVVEGLDHGVITRLIAAGGVPHLADLSQSSGVVQVISTPGAESASAAASLATGTNPGTHGVFDAIAPDPVTGQPLAATLQLRPSTRWFGSLWRGGAAYAPVRDGAAFWTTLGAAGLTTRVLFMPGTFPPERVPAGTLISGTPLPDWGGGWGTGYTWLASDVTPQEVGFTRYGGRVERLSFNRNIAHATLVGLRAPERIEIPLSVRWSPEERSANLTIGDQSVHLNEGQRSRWIPITARVSLFTRVAGLARLHLVKAGNDVQVYVSPIQWHPGNPPSAISSPSGAASTLLARLGPFRTLAWPEAAWPLADGRVTEDTFVLSQEETFDDRAAALLNQAESAGWSLLVGGIETLEATSRMPVRSSAVSAIGAQRTPGAEVAVSRAYARLDTLVGELRRRLSATADFAIVSPHGLAPARQVIDLNRWLAERGWLVWREPPSPVTLAALADPSAWTDTIDWAKTSVRNVGSGHLYLNVRGRDPQGVVEPGAAYDALVADLRDRLGRLVDPVSGERLVARVRMGREAFPGARTLEGPDLVVTFAPGVRLSWDSMLGGSAADVVAPNTERWEAEHAAIDEARVPGVWISSVPLGASTISIMDVAPTVLQYFGVSIPAAVEGRPQLRDIPSRTSRK
jgi:predicted AlkP superfamily phosphohydrolase/phosphomutase